MNKPSDKIDWSKIDLEAKIDPEEIKRLKEN